MKTKEIFDSEGNKIICTRSEGIITIKLKLIGEPRYRSVGVVNLSAKALVVNRVRSKHLFRKNNSYGLNHKVLAEAKKFDKVLLRDDYGGEWLIPVKFILEHGSFMNFKKQGFELQIFVTLEQILFYKM